VPPSLDPTDEALTGEGVRQPCPGGALGDGKIGRRGAARIQASMPYPGGCPLLFMVGRRCSRPQVTEKDREVRAFSPEDGARAREGGWGQDGSFERAPSP